MEVIQLWMPLEIPERREIFVDLMIEELIKWYQPPGPIGHIDLNKFYANLALNRRPDLEGKPFGVHNPYRGTPIMAVNELASECGFDSAMPKGLAEQICQEKKERGEERCQGCSGLQFAIEDQKLQAEASADFYNLIAKCNPGIPQAPYGGVDECFIGYGQSQFSYDRAFIQFGKTIEFVNRKMGAKYGLALSASGCVAPNIWLAKMGTNSVKNKKDVVWLPMSNISYVKKFYDWPVRKFHMIGPKTSERLEKAGIKTIGDLADTPLSDLKVWLGDAFGTRVYLWSHGIDEFLVEPSPPGKSIGRSIRCKFQYLEHIQGRMRLRAGQVAKEMQKDNYWGNVVKVKLEFIKEGKKASISSQKTLSYYFNDLETIFRVGKDLLFPLYIEAREVIKTDIRRVEVRVEGVSQRIQLRLL